MPDPTTVETACTAAVDLPDIRCASPDHPHYGCHHAVRILPDGTRCTVFWRTPDTVLKDEQLDRDLPHLRVDVPAAPPPRIPPRLRRSDYYTRPRFPS